MHLEQKEPSKKVKDKPEKEKDLKIKKDKEFRLIWRLLGKDNLMKNNLP